MSDYRFCNGCKQDKPADEFYRRGKWYTSECKACMKARSKRHVRIDKKVAVVQSETDVIKELARLGIPALPGKALAQQWCDVLIGGALLCEVKSSHFIKQGCYHFGFTQSQQNGKLRGDIVVLVCKPDNAPQTYHVFPASHPMFYKNGKLRNAVCWTPNRKRSGPKSILTTDMMTAAKDNWQLVHDYLKQISDRLRFGETLPIMLSKAA